WKTVMSRSIHTVKLRTPRDVIVARQRARQIAGLLGFAPEEQAFITAAVGEVARSIGRGTLDFQVDDNILRVAPATREPGHNTLPHARAPRVAGPNSLRTEKALPSKATALDPDHLAWAIQELEHLTPLNVAEEVRQQDRELLRVMHELHKCRAELDRVRAQKA